MSLRRTLFLAAASLLLAAAPSAPSARAEEAPAPDVATQVKALVAELNALEKAKDNDGLVKAAKRAGPLFKETADAALRLSLAKELGGVVRSTRLGYDARRAALDAVVATEDSSIGWKALSSAYPGHDSEDVEKFDAEIVRGIGLLHPDAAIEPLLETFRKAKMSYLAAEAVKALGNYGKSKQRERILLEIVKTGKNMVPSKGRTTNVSQETMQRWTEVSPGIGAALDGLTGDKVGDPLEWFKRVDEAKKNIKSLFKN